MFKDSGQDVVKLHASDSARNAITAAFRARLEKLLDRREVSSGLSAPEKVTGRANGDLEAASAQGPP